MTDIGTIALSVRSPPIDSARVISQPRSAPVDRGEDDVVDGAAVGVADRAVVGQVGADGDEAALLRERPR